MQHTCRNPWCKQPFEITSDDLAFYEEMAPTFAGKKFDIPTPIHCPECRDRLRYTFRNERHLYHRACDLCGKEMISIYAPEKPLKAYCPTCFFSDRWDAASFGRTVDLQRPFFEQFAELKREVPRLAIDVLNNENSDYSNISIENKNCYLVFATVRSERCMHCRKVIQSRDSLDSSYCERIELCYECIDCANCYQLLFSELCTDCAFSSFLYDCIGVQHCFLCSNLRNKQYCYMNQQLTKEQYETKLKALMESTPFPDLRKKFQELKISAIHRADQNIQTENCSGNYLRNCKNCFGCFDIHHSEDCTYCNEAVTGLKSSMDCSFITMECERVFESCSCSNATIASCFSFGCRDGNHRLLYCDSVYSCHDLFGCVGLRHKERSILNKQYSREEYEKLASQIIEHMRHTGEWGLFFPA
ncbi:MAG: hypothetical protein PHI23_02825, partial [Candidatus Peribacteraceae bacterium]|nr:hypothetical protein [Candidatus Peribacteraceae bacterium]